MIPNNLLDIKTEGNISGEHISMTIDEDSLQHIMGVLTDLYSDTAMACIREYSTNARDAQIEAGHDGPIDITLPSMMLPVFKVRDYGKGLSLDDIRNVYSKYGASTKRESNGFNGMLGLGAKSALTYTSSFTVASVNGGYRHVVEVGRDEDGGGYMNIVDSFPSDEPSGVEVQIPVGSAAIDNFSRKVWEFFQWWDEGTFRINGEAKSLRPDHLIALDHSDRVFIDNTTYGRYSTERVDLFIMGGVAYLSPFESILHSGRVVYFAEMGELTFSPSRESLLMNSKNRKVRDEVQKGIQDNVLRQVMREIDKSKSYAGAYLNWNKFNSNLITPALGNNAIAKINFRNQPLSGYPMLFKAFDVRDEKVYLCVSEVAVGPNGDFLLIGGTNSTRYFSPAVIENLAAKAAESSILIHSAPLNGKSSRAVDLARRGLTHLGHKAGVFMHTGLPLSDPKVQSVVKAYDGITVIDWADIRKASREYLKNNKTGSARPKKAPGEFDVMIGLTSTLRMDSARSSIPSDGENVVYLHRGMADKRSSHLWDNSRWERIRTIDRHRNDSGKTFVLVPEADQALFKTKHPKALHWNEYINDLYGPKLFEKVKEAMNKEFGRTFTDSEVRSALKTGSPRSGLRWEQHRFLNTISALAPKVQDPRFSLLSDKVYESKKYQKAISSVISLNSIDINRIFEAYVSGLTSKSDSGGSVETTLEDIISDYPLVSVYDAMREHPGELARYVNMVYAENNKTD